MSFSLLPISKSNFYTDMSTNICFNRPNIFMMSFSLWIPKYIFIPLELFGSQVLSYFAPGVALPKVMWTRFLILTLTSHRTFVCNILQLFWFFIFALHGNSLQSQEKKCWFFFSYSKIMVAENKIWSDDFIKAFLNYLHRYTRDHWKGKKLSHWNFRV